MNEWAAKIPDLAEREEAARLFTVLADADNALSAARRNQSFESEDVPEIAALEAVMREKRHELSAWYDAERARILGPSPLDNLQFAANEAQAAYNDAPGDAIEEDDEGQALRCALSGAPIYETDETIELGAYVVLASLFVPHEIIERFKVAEDDGEGD